MAQTEANPDPDKEAIVTTKDAENDGTAPDSETQSGAASEAGDRTAEDGSRAPSDPAEGA